MPNHPIFHDNPDLPPTHHTGRRGRPSTWKAPLDALRSRPGQWAIIPGVSSPGSYARRIQLGEVGMAQPGEFEAKSHNRQLWVRYVGDGTALPTAADEVARLLDTWPADLPEGLRDAVLDTIRRHQ